MSDGATANQASAKAIGVGQLRGRIREYFLLEDAQLRASKQNEADRTTIRAYYDAAQKRLSVARDLRGPTEVPAALSLYREGGLFLVLAVIASKSTGADVAKLGPESAIRELDQVLAGQDSAVTSAL